MLLESIINTVKTHSCVIRTNHHTRAPDGFTGSAVHHGGRGFLSRCARSGNDKRHSTVRCVGMQGVLSLTTLLRLLLLLTSSATTILAMTTTSKKSIINHLLHKTDLKQSFFALRHGQSLANVAKIISSDPQVSTVKHGLSGLGKEQARKAGESFVGSIESAEPYRGVAVFSSDFTRARETAAIFADELSKSNVPIYMGDVILEERLRERYFGELNGDRDDRYQEVWDVDAKDPNHNQFSVEPANSVLERTTRLVTDLDDELGAVGGPWRCILVAHGDVLQIMQTGFLKHDDAARHRSLDHLETATIRKLKLT